MRTSRSRGGSNKRGRHRTRSGSNRCRYGIGGPLCKENVALCKARDIENLETRWRTPWLLYTPRVSKTRGLSGLS